ncbi:hypothetical protein EG328_002009 [Venturia inaequalis]|uniref:Prefoldin subunit 6 n=1 Tax=Venturia inaequalis TaxID=5025 RepID=A0A8H3Z1N5_VENIN|nr:hypothetical protein EG328_002009 [Venturia inaequalis]KAE9984308.1 hypothetical protein EG327_005069 [Venturia inaequalis]RDI78537.1 Transcription initiation factor TFIID subunit 5 [Venturia inaequalis]
MSDPQKQLQALSDAYTDLQNDLTTLITKRRTLSSQLTESTSVQTTLSPLPPKNQIYKLVGPVLLKQDKADATMSVDARVKFIEGRISEVETQIADTQAKMEGVRGEIIQLQSRMEQPQGAGKGVKA